MKPKTITRISFPLATAIAALLAASHSHSNAASLYWDTDDSTAGAGGVSPSGTWVASGTNWSTNSNGTVAIPAYTTLSTDDLFISAGVAATGSPVITLTSPQDAGSLTFQEGSTTISGGSGIINLGGAGGKITVNNGAAANIGATTDTIIGGSVGLTKIGVGTLTLNGSLANTLTGGLRVNGGTLALNFANMATPTNLIDSSNVLELGGGRLLITGLTGAFTTDQTLGDVTVNSGGGRILGDKNGGTALNIILGTLTHTASGGSLLVGAGGTAANAPVITTTSGTLTNGIYSGRAVFFDGNANTGYDWATTLSAGPAFTLSGLVGGSYTALDLTAGTDTSNSTISASATMTGSRTTNSLKFAVPATAQTLTNTGFTLTLGSGGLLFTGNSVTQGPRISDGTITAGNGSGSYDLVVHNYNATNAGLLGSGVNPANNTSINSIIANNGTKPVTLVKNGPSPLYLGGANTFTGGIIVNEGSIYAGVAGALNNNPITFNANSIFSTTTATASNGVITLNNNAQVTFINNNTSFTTSGAVTGTGGISIEKGGLGSITVNLNSTANTFTGPILFPHRQQNQQAHLTLNSLTDTSALGEGNITFGATPSHTTGLSVSQNFNYGSGATAPLTLNNRRFELATIQISHQINNNSGQPVNINTDLLVSGTTGKNLSLGGAGAGISTFAGTIANHPTPTTGTTILGQNGSVYVATNTNLMLASVEGIVVGATISAATGIPVGATITAVNPATRVVTISPALTANPGIGSTITIPGVTNSVSVSKAGASTWVLTGTNTYTGATVIDASGGVLQLGNGGTSGSLSTGSAISIGTSATFAVNQSDTVTQGIDFSNLPITGAGGFRQAGAGNTILNQANTYTGATTVNAGTLVLAKTSAVQTSSGISMAIGTTLQLATDTGFTTLPTISGASGVTAATFISDRATTGAGLTHALGTPTFGANTFNFTNGPNVTSGTAGISFDAVNMTSGIAGTTVLNPTTALLSIVGGVTGGGTDVARTLDLGGTGTGHSIGGAIANGVATPMSLTKSDTSTWTLTGTSTYTGPTTISGGTLLVNSPGSLDAASAVDVNGGTLGGNGTIGGTVTVAAGGSLAPGASAGTLTISSGLDVSAQASGTGKLNYELDALANTNDQIAVTGTLTIGVDVLGFNDFVFTNLGGLQVGTYTLITSAGITALNTLDPANLTGTLPGGLDGALAISGNNIVLNVTSSGTTYASWIAGFAVGLLNGVTDDPDFDGIDNGTEMVLGGNPAAVMDTALLPTIQLVNADPDGDTTFSDYLLFTYRRSDLSVAAGVTADCETDTDLVAPWTAATGAPGVVILVDDNFTFTPPAAADTDRVRVYVPRGANTKLFGRLKVVVP